MSDPILVECEGGGQNAHLIYGSTLPGMCPMCGEVVATFAGKCHGHRRKDIFAMLARGDFDE